MNRKRDIKQAAIQERKRGRPRKGEIRPPKEPTRIEAQCTHGIRNSLSKLEKSCVWGCKKNSQGNISTWKGYKLHLDVTDTGFPISVVVTGANVHDSQVAIPLEKLTELKVDHLYSVMDAAYDADAVSAFIRFRGRVPLIDPNKRRGVEKVSFVLMCGVVCLAALKTLQYFNSVQPRLWERPWQR